MEEHISPLADNFNKIKECFLDKRSHMFCVDCLERNNVVEDPCQLCRPFYALPDNGCGGYSRDNLMEKLVDLHKSFVERNSKCADTTIDLPLVEQFILGGVQSRNSDLYVAWLDNKIYVMHFGIKTVRVFIDQWPFTELPEQFTIKKLVSPCGMVASTLSNSIFISDTICIWKIQLPDNKLSRIRVSPEPEDLSITPDNELLAVLRNISLDIFNLEDLSRTKSIQVPIHCDEITCAAQLPNMNFVVSYSKAEEGLKQGICILTSEGNVIQKFDPNMFELIQRDPWCPTSFAVDDDGRIFISDSKHRRLFVFNSQMTDFHMLSNIQFRSIESVPSIVYIKDRRRLLLCEDSVDMTSISLSMFHLSPCNLIRGSYESLHPAVNKSRIERKRTSAKNVSSRNCKKTRVEEEKEIIIS